MALEKSRKKITFSLLTQFWPSYVHLKRKARVNFSLFFRRAPILLLRKSYLPTLQKQTTSAHRRLKFLFSSHCFKPEFLNIPNITLLSFPPFCIFHKSSLPTKVCTKTLSKNLIFLMRINIYLAESVVKIIKIIRFKAST